MIFQIENTLFLYVKELKVVSYVNIKKIDMLIQGIP